MGHKYASDRKVRHADEVRHGQPESRPHRKKNTRRWCRGKTGVEHESEVVIYSWYGRPWSCGWRERQKWRNYSDHRMFEGIGDWRYVCGHIERCTACGRRLRFLSGEECPDYQPREVAA